MEEQSIESLVQILTNSDTEIDDNAAKNFADRAWDVFEYETARSLCSYIANVNVTTSHPNDNERLNIFLLNAYNEKSRFVTSEFTKLLRIINFPSDWIKEVSAIYDKKMKGQRPTRVR